jgi:lipoic acid synthetase
MTERAVRLELPVFGGVEGAPASEGRGAGPEGAPRRPPWLRVRAPGGPNYRDLTGLVDRLRLHTVCQSARCPNIGDCWERRTATFMILGDICTRSCGFCAIKTGRPLELDRDEPERVAEAVASLQLRHAVITSVNRDELADGGAAIFAETIRQIRARCPDTSIEVLIPDFRGVWWALEQVMEAGPDILNHNMESIARLYGVVRPQAKYPRSLELLRRAKEMAPGVRTKSGMMLGYLRPSLDHIPVRRYVPPEEFVELRRIGLEMGFRHVESGPLVRSSYHADEQVASRAI